VGKLQQLLFSDVSLLRKYAGGDTAAFDMLFRRHKDALFNFLFRSLPNHAIVEEIAQETWLTVIQQAAAYKPDAAFRTWLFTIARNKLIDHQRRRINTTPNADDELLAAIRSQDLPAEDQALLRELLDALDKLPNDQREAFVLQQEGFSNKQIARITGVGDETVKSRLRYAKTATRSRMGVAS
jgi:RNA polymerase sigma-70 factor (ECF subfamily)